MENELKPKQIETFADDMVKALDNPGEGMIKKIIEEQEAHEEEKINMSPETTKNRLFMIIGMFLFIIAIIAVFFVIFNKDIGSVLVKPQFTPLIFTDSNVLVETKGLSKEKITDALLEKIALSEIKEGEVEGIYFAKNGKTMGLRDFLPLMKPSLDISKNEFFEDNFLTGIKNGATKDLFILIKMRSLYDVFPTLSAWESKMFLDLHPLWGIEINSENAYLLTKNFEDGVAQNKNARILYDNSGKIVLMYVHLEDTAILITNSEVATKEVIQRLASSKVKK